MRSKVSKLDAVGVAIVVAATAALTTSAGARVPATWMGTSCVGAPLRQHPVSFAFSCDNAIVFRHVHWQRWGRARATGHGILWRILSCNPNCAQAPRYRYRVRLVASDVAYCGSRRVYTRVTAYANRPVDGRSRVLRGPTLTECPG